MAEFIALKNDDDYREAFHILKELDDGWEPDLFISAMHHELSCNTKIFAIKHSGVIVSVAAVWFLMTGRFKKILGKKQSNFGRNQLASTAFHNYAERMIYLDMRLHKEPPIPRGL